MSGAVIAIRALLAARAEVADLVPAERIRIGPVPLNGDLPAISISDVSGDEVPTVARRRPFTMNRARVQVTVYARDYATQEKVLLAAKLGTGVHTGIINGVHVNAVEPAGVGPAIPPGEDGIFERSRDFMVTFKEAN